MVRREGEQGGRRRREVGGAKESKRHAGRGGEVSVAVGFARRGVLNRARGSRIGNFCRAGWRKNASATKVFGVAAFSRTR
jgi:hypothetical protein